MLKATDENTTVYYTRGFELISRREGTTASYYVYDGGLSVRALTNEAGTVTDTLVFDAFGNETGRTGSTNNTYGFQGEEQDATGLYYLRARYLDPATGTFTTIDTYGGSLSDPMSLHKYLFANSNPVMYCDPSGHSTLLTETNTVVAIVFILASAIAYSIIMNSSSKTMLSSNTFGNSVYYKTINNHFDIRSLCVANKCILSITLNAVIKFINDNITSAAQNNVDYGLSNSGGTIDPNNSRTRWGNEHGRNNIKHNNAIEDELDDAFERGGKDIRKNGVQIDADGNRVYYDGTHYIRPDASYTIDGVRYNTNYISNQSLTNLNEISREFNSFIHMVQADPSAVNRLVYIY